MKYNMKKNYPGTYKIYIPINLMILKIVDIINPFKMSWMIGSSKMANLWI